MKHFKQKVLGFNVCRRESFNKKHARLVRHVSVYVNVIFFTPNGKTSYFNSMKLNKQTSASDILWLLHTMVIRTQFWSNNHLHFP